MNIFLYVQEGVYSQTGPFAYIYLYTAKSLISERNFKMTVISGTVCQHGKHRKHFCIRYFTAQWNDYQERRACCLSLLVSVCGRGVPFPNMAMLSTMLGMVLSV